jgi:CRISPR-associated endonuclease/helicase Cas3
MFGRRTKETERSAPPLPIEQCLAKSYEGSDGSILRGKNILDHCQIVGAVAKGLILRMPPWLRSVMFPEGSDLIAASHDIGKVSPTFQRKILEALSQKDEVLMSGLKDFDPEMEKQWGGHAGVSQLTADALGTGACIPKILGQHHGFSPNLSSFRAQDEVFGGEQWLLQRISLVKLLRESLNTDFPIIENPLQARVLSGLTTVSDWIGSGTLFIDPSDTEWDFKIGEALDQAGFIFPDIKPGLSFREIFGFAPRDPQTRFYEAASQHGVYILEAPMGSGKTEAALYAAYRMMEKGQATGLYFALPTQLTSDRIHERVNVFLKKVLSCSSPHKKALLLHGNAWLRETEMGEEGNPGGSWFNRGKRGILAPFAVGTIDQALMAVLNVKHGFVRTFGLAGKVVILDEVHSYDSFTGTILDALVNDLRDLRCTVILLSATLTRERRSFLIGTESQEEAYPLIIAQPTSGRLLEIVPEPESDVVVDVGHRGELEAIEEALIRAEGGQQVLWIENTVGDAQDLFRRLSSRGKESGILCGLLHSRFTKKDRSSREEEWIRFYGNENREERSRQGRILVGTQVLEQSLDIDADFLVTRIAPTDMLLQRLGRLWRHKDMFRPDLARREAWILSPDLDSVIVSAEGFGKTAKVYAPYVLCRTLMVWKDISSVSLPGQIREMIEMTYASRQEEIGSMPRYLRQVEERRETLKRMALLGLAQGGKTLPEEKAETRFSTMVDVEVLLIRSCRLEIERQSTVLKLLDGTELVVPFRGRSLPFPEWKQISVALMQHTLRVPQHLAPMPVSKKGLEWIGDYFYLGKQEFGESLLRIGLVDLDGQVRSYERDLANDHYSIWYDSRTGYSARRDS